MEPLTSIHDSAINSKYDYLLDSSRVLTIPLVRCDDQVFNRLNKQENIDETDHIGLIKQEIIDETDHNNGDQFSLIGTICKTEKDVNSTDIEIKIEKDLIENDTFEGTIFKNKHSSELITRVEFGREF
ncbi:uncharacterized protein LOC132952883 [Metopolophium dirhodum]|uniref:uncharacterized protein LOC132952883 n=1 Tax=Metopolophium dirhodum TaxID=44670 RepID=UPI0029902041|nr:uncharacterized protein LOC132952883 [Metopolophium dirhodum]